MMNKSEMKAIKKAIRRLRNEDKRLSADMVPHLEALRPFLDTWVIHPLNLLVKENRTLDDLKRASKF